MSIRTNIYLILTTHKGGRRTKDTFEDAGTPEEMAAKLREIADELDPTDLKATKVAEKFLQQVLDGERTPGDFANFLLDEMRKEFPDMTDEELRNAIKSDSGVFALLKDSDLFRDDPAAKALAEPIVSREKTFGDKEPNPVVSVFQPKPDESLKFPKEQA